MRDKQVLHSLIDLIMRKQAELANILLEARNVAIDLERTGELDTPKETMSTSEELDTFYTILGTMRKLGWTKLRGGDGQ